MGSKKDRSIIEATLYAADRPLTSGELREILGTTSETYVSKILQELTDEYRSRGGPLAVVETAKNTFSLSLSDEYMRKLEGVIPKTKLSRGSLKTLALIAYRQPIYQARLADLRGRRVYEHVKQLSSLGFIDSKPFGRTRMLRTSRRFAGYFGFEDDMEKIRERLEELSRYG